MKKIIAVTLTVVALLSALTVTVFAEQYEATPKVNFSEDYIVSVFNGALTRRYNTGGWFSDVRASTDISLANDHSGYAHVWIQGLNREIKTGGSSMDGTYGKDCNNVINSGIVSVPGQDYAINVLHEGWRDYPDGSFDTYCVDCIT